MSAKTSAATRRAVLLMAYGSPESLDDMEAYLLDIRGGRPTPPDLVGEIRERYRRIGGSPLTRITLAQARAVESELARRGDALSVYVGMRHWRPRIAEAVAAMARDGVREAAAIVMAPHASPLSTGRYLAQVEAAVRESGQVIGIFAVGPWWRQEALLDAFAENIRAGLARPDPGEGATVVFTAHSLPRRAGAETAAYEAALRENARMLAERAGVADWRFAFQSAGASPEPWLGPALEDELPELAARGCRAVLVVPIGFVCDHVEILYDIDIEAAEIARRHGLRLGRTESLNTSPRFIQAVADAIQAAFR